MKERPIIFSTENVKAILNGQKTQTRRVIKPQPNNLYPLQQWVDDKPQPTDTYVEFPSYKYFQCPYGQVGQRLWVKETFNDYFVPLGIIYKANGNPIPNNEKWRPSIHMPRWASRITLEITEIRVERQLDITLEDAIAEGFGEVKEFNETFLRLNPKLKEVNPWVWVIEFAIGVRLK